jgi:hypothetical protein
MDNIQIHIKLLNSVKEEESDKNIWKVEGNSILNKKSLESYTVTNIIYDGKSNEEIYSEFLKDSVNNNFIKGTGFCILTYGQSFTKNNFFKSNDENCGILYSLFKHIFSFYSPESRLDVKVYYV